MSAESAGLDVRRAVPQKTCQNMFINFCYIESTCLSGGVAKWSYKKRKNKEKETAECRCVRDTNNDHLVFLTHI